MNNNHYDKTKTKVHPGNIISKRINTTSSFSSYKIIVLN